MDQHVPGPSKMGTLFAMPFDSGDLERELCRIPDVLAARISSGGPGEGTEARILAGRERTPKRVRRDVQSVAMESFGIALPSGAISVTQLEHASPRAAGGDGDVEGELQAEVAAGEVAEPPATEPPATEPPATEPPATEPPATKETGVRADETGGAGGNAQPSPPSEVPARAPDASTRNVEPLAHGRAIVVRSVSISVVADRCVAEVEVGLGEATGAGRAEGALASAMVARTMAEAAVTAAAQADPSLAGAGVEEAQIVDMAGRRVVVVTISRRGGGGEDAVGAGSAVPGALGEHHAIARAALDAVARDAGT